MKSYILIISPAWAPTYACRQERANAVKWLAEMGWHKLATNTFRGHSESAEKFENQFRPVIPHAANWRLIEIAAETVISGKNFPRTA